MTFRYPYQKNYSSWVYRFEINTTSLVYTSRNSNLSMVNPWFDINKSYFKSGVTVRNSGVRKLYFEIIALYKCNGKVVGYGKNVLCSLDPGSARDYNVSGSSAAEYNEVEHVINDCATYQ